jgi:hypothetical protein
MTSSTPFASAGSRWSVPQPDATSAPGTSRAASSDRSISASDVGQSRPMPRCAVSIASATPRPSDHRRCRVAIVASQSIVAVSQGSTLASGSATTCAAEYAMRVNGFAGAAAANAAPPRSA